MLFNSAITVLSFANKVVKVQPQKFIRSLYVVPRTLQYVQLINHAEIFILVRDTSACEVNSDRFVDKQHSQCLEGVHFSVTHPTDDQ